MSVPSGEPCRKCAANGRQSCATGHGYGFLCDVCMDAALSGAEKNRRIFEGLLSSGVPRDRANDLMIARIEGDGASA